MYPKIINNKLLDPVILLIDWYIYIFSNPIFLSLTVFLAFIVLGDFITRKNTTKKSLYDSSNAHQNVGQNFKILKKISDPTKITFGCCWRYESKKRIHGRMFVNDRSITFFSPISITYEDEEIISKYSSFPGMLISDVTRITLEYTQISRMIRRGGNKVLRGSVTFEIYNNSDIPLELMFCHFFHTKFVYDLLSKLCTLSCSRIHETILGDKNNDLSNIVQEKSNSIENLETLGQLDQQTESIIPNEPCNFLLYNIQDKISINSNCDLDQQNVYGILAKKASNDFEEFINEYDFNSIPTSSLSNVFPCVIIPLKVQKIFSILSNHSLDSSKNVYLKYLELSGASNIQIESRPCNGDFMLHFTYTYEKSLNIAGGFGIGWLSKNVMNIKCQEDLKLYNLGNEVGILLCVDVNSTGIPENDAFTVNIRHRFTPFKTISNIQSSASLENDINNKPEDEKNNFVQLDIECDVTFYRFSFFKSPVVQNAIEQTRKGLDLIRSSWKMHY
ncbi:uncharacterized protein cubi_03184 [Cryptosporidium ubiquitum]|uniref:VASt domain-containing protein n=1 Tax=Cryptosporidium ubiquitum TaxID=857276 RepID=A0A1J4MLU6_9CRYT|nr:uncharacterized protein cubi_03184 [Cryptosporidium ubiquitum]OII75168.1 hypothetical protein cubi_03184 [Cryptosporidium ubiquitum]